MTDLLNMNGKLRICYGTCNPALGKAVVEHLNLPGTEIILKAQQFADGEILTDYDSTLRGCDLFIVQPVSVPDVNAALMELLLAIDAAKRACAARVTAVIPYYGYARQDRKAKMRQPISAKVVADMLTAVGVNHVVSIDIHTQQIQGFFSASVPLDFIPGDMIFLPALCKLYKETKFMVASTDAGGAARCRELAHKFNTDIAIVDKKRNYDAMNQSEVMSVIGDVTGRNVVIYDDMCDTAGSLCKAAAAIKRAGAVKVFGCVTHAVLSADAAQKIRDSVFDQVFFSDTIHIPDEKLAVMGKVTIISCAEILATVVRVIHLEESLGNYIQCQKELIAKLINDECQ
ncbi:Ribose-phosphate_pyrophosphokinase [Hexamita inflata]|uniref:ribose-phosphate diphosphokinase n=1 Tax=Hexamita inflata TaxID=28002 RepID=A0AA86PML1_9EUKA|nr:Ribose-phosphate pyrophosphokinase [Hexamita inflata]